MDSLIINRPELQSKGQRVLYSFITFSFWLLWVYIWLPLFSLIAWGFGVQIFYDEMILTSGLDAFLHVSMTYGTVIMLIGFTLISWALYNFFRFRKKERRSKAKPLGNNELATYFRVDATQLTHWQQANRVVVYHNDTGDIESVDIENPETATVTATADNRQVL